MRRHNLTNKKTMTMTKTMKKTKTMTIEEHPQRTIPETCDLRDTGYISDNWEQQSQHSQWPWIKSERDSIRNSCDVFLLFHLISRPGKGEAKRGKNHWPNEKIDALWSSPSHHHSDYPKSSSSSLSHQHLVTGEISSKWWFFALSKWKVIGNQWTSKKTIGKQTDTYWTSRNYLKNEDV